MADVRRSERCKNPSRKIAARQQDEADAADALEKAAKKRAEKQQRNQQKLDYAAGIIPEDNGERKDRVPEFTSRSVMSKPKAIAKRALRASKVPVPPQPEPLSCLTPPAPYASQHHSTQGSRIPKDPASQRPSRPQSRIPESLLVVSQPHSPRTPPRQRLAPAVPEPQPASQPPSQPLQSSRAPCPPSQPSRSSQAPRPRSQSSESGSRYSRRNSQSDDNLPPHPWQSPRLERSPTPDIGGSHNFRSQPPEQAGTKRKYLSDRPVASGYSKKKRKGRPKVSDYVETEQVILTSANVIYRCILSTENAFPYREEELELVRRAWDLAFDTGGLDFVTMSHDMFRVVRGRGPQIRGEAKTKIIPLVESIYGFDSRRKRRVIEANRKLAMMLKHEKNFLYESLGEENQGLYLNPIIQKSINMLWFSDLQDEGPQYPLVFGPNGMLPIYAIAFVLTVIECGIDMWLTGIKKDITFRSSQYRGVYMTHVDLLLKYEKGTQELDLLNKLRRRLYRRAAISAGVNLPSDNPRPIIPASAYANAMQQHKENPQESESDDLYED